VTMIPAIIKVVVNFMTKVRSTGLRYLEYRDKSFRITMGFWFTILFYLRRVLSDFLYELSDFVF
jgi:hypothetical protein